MTNGEAYMPVSYDTMFIWLCSTSKCNNLTYNTSLYTRKRTYNKLEGRRKKIEKRKKKKETQKKRKGKISNI